MAVCELDSKEVLCVNEIVKNGCLCESNGAKQVNPSEQSGEKSCFSYGFKLALCADMLLQWFRCCVLALQYFFFYRT